MRDPARIEKLIDALRRVWRVSPDMRLGQIVVNAANPKEPAPQVFYIEDDRMLDRLHTLAAVMEANLRDRKLRPG